jgi:hypothetical protein
MAAGFQYGKPAAMLTFIKSYCFFIDGFVFASLRMKQAQIFTSPPYRDPLRTLLVKHAEFGVRVSSVLAGKSVFEGLIKH